ncbi:hypothetical protein FN846DRAFT_885696 [Sphaerosporella brunnea]|uniref:Uncharacterized protein n=1 Tax=Sphaerosporella brunnea TaxID=1250544 RepID=A0A5J5FBE2_9PEZI|nr:hypothetical protein FN846DRAFT_885696 [Sphaerosporella brunnea]
MPRPSKRTLHIRKAGLNSAESGKRRRLKASAEGEAQTPVLQDTGVTDSEGDLESDVSNKEVELSDPEDDVLELKQPARGWAQAERRLPGYLIAKYGHYVLSLVSI